MLLFAQSLVKPLTSNLSSWFVVWPHNFGNLASEFGFSWSCSWWCSGKGPQKTLKGFSCFFCGIWATNWWKTPQKRRKWGGAGGRGGAEWKREGWRQNKELEEEVDVRTRHRKQGKEGTWRKWMDREKKDEEKWTGKHLTKQKWTEWIRWHIRKSKRQIRRKRRGKWRKDRAEGLRRRNFKEENV